MPQGFSSIADLKVIIDANTEKFHSGVQGVNGILDTLQKTSGQSLGGIDQLMQIIGDTALTVSGKARAAAMAVEAGIAVYSRLAEEGRAAAEALGVTTEYDRLIATIDDLGMDIKDGAVAAFFELQSAGSETVGSMLSFASGTDEAAKSSENFAAVLLNKVSAGLDGARLNLRLFLKDALGVTNDVGTTVSLAEGRLAEVNAELASLESSGPSTRTVGRGAIVADTRERDLLAERVQLQKQLAEMKAMIPGGDGNAWSGSTVTTISLLEDEIAALKKRDATLGMSAGAAAEFTAFEKAKAAALRQNIDLTEDQVAVMRADAAEVGRRTQALDDFTKVERESLAAKQRSAQMEKTESSIFANAERELLTLNQRARALQLNAGEVAELNMQERLRQQLRSAGVKEDDGQIIMIKALSAAARDQTEALAAQAERMQDLQAVGDSISSNLGNAFARWTDGAKFDVKSMVASMLSDLAQLTFQRSVLDTLFGGRGGGSSGGGVAGSLISSIFGGFRADGGDVAAGSAYVVGERGPELFLPGKSGTILPNGAVGGATAIHLHTTIDARGASPDAIARLESMMAQRDAALPQQVLSVIQNSRDRGLS